MKNLLSFILLIISLTVASQELPTEPENSFAFPLGSKFTIKLHAIDSVNFYYSIIEYESYQAIINDYYNNDTLFKPEGQSGTIEFYFGISTRGETEKERDENMVVVLLMKNRTEYSLTYKSDILRKEDGEFEETSNIGCFAGARGSETWPHMIYQIGLHDFKKM